VKISNEIEIAAPPDELFEFLSDVERVAPMLPGAKIEGRSGDDYAGSMKVKVGPINATYQGTMRFLDRDPEARRAVMKARAEEVNGQGNAEAEITTEVTDADGKSLLKMDTDLQMRGKVAQFGRGAMEKISQRMFDQFARNIEQQFAAGNGKAPSAPEPEQDTGERPSERTQADAPAASRGSAGTPAAPAEAEALDAFALFVKPALGKLAPIGLPAVLGFGYGYLLGRLRELRRR
jgi:carbon monoxide dehydrogenase subunit G